MRKSVKMLAIFIVAATISFACTSCTPLSENKFYFEEDGWMALEKEYVPHARIIGYKRLYEDMTELVLPVELKGLKITAIDGSLGRTYDLPKKLFVPIHQYIFQSSFCGFPEATSKMIFLSADPNVYKAGFRHQKNPDNAEAPYFLTHSKRFIPKMSLGRYNELYERYSKPNFKTANISYYYDYEGSPNEGYCWIDDLEIGEKIKTIPEEPIREGYEFAGWYRTGEDEPFDFTAYTKDENELELFAKWISQK